MPSEACTKLLCPYHGFTTLQGRHTMVKFLLQCLFFIHTPLLQDTQSITTQTGLRKSQ